MKIWIDYILEAFRNLGGEARLSEIYDEVKKLRLANSASLSRTWKATVRREIEQNSSDSEAFVGNRGDLFYAPKGKGRGVWALRKRSFNYKKMIIIKTTSDSHKTIKLIANTLLNKKYAACINIVPRMRSKYIWEGRIAESRETMLLIKTVDAMEKNVYKTIKELHNYDIPEITTMETKNVDSDYLNWVNELLSEK